ncbi:MAG TPA: GTP 3',8-cyclase MoaA [Gammaproteobacteria bacterium]|nr:GTP 3',8-cyclase MoaA [Gammaproteobacteria bacterium]
MNTGLIDPFGRSIEYVRLSVTDRCDLRCFYCLPGDYRDFSEPEEWLTFAEVERVIRAFAILGVQRIRITGGEPLVRKGLATLTGQLSRIPGIEDLSLSTNAVTLSRHAAALYQAGIKRINVSLDSLRADRFKEITRGNLDKVMDGLMAAKHVGFQPIKINMVVMKDINDDEIRDMVEFCIEHDFTLRLIETMPIGDTGRSATDHYLDLQTVKARLAEDFKLIPGIVPGGGPARYVQIAGTRLKIGFITPISQHFCETCNRVRLAVDGTLYLCLGQDHKFELRPLLRAGIDDAGLLAAVRAAISLKPERHEFLEKPQQLVRFMAKTGG